MDEISANDNNWKWMKAILKVKECQSEIRQIIGIGAIDDKERLRLEALADDLFSSMMDALVHKNIADHGAKITEPVRPSSPASLAAFRAAPVPSLELAWWLRPSSPDTLLDDDPKP